MFARLTPDNKRALIEALTGHGAYVAMIGDGVNDVPAMKASRLAIALGSGSQLAKSVADSVLVADSFRRHPARRSARAARSSETSSAWPSCSSPSRCSPPS